MARLQLDYGGRYHPLHYNQVSIYSNFGQRDVYEIEIERIGSSWQRQYALPL